MTTPFPLPGRVITRSLVRSRTNNNRITKHYDKSISTGLLTNYLNFISTTYKLGYVKTLADPLYKIIQSWTGFHNDNREN